GATAPPLLLPCAARVGPSPTRGAAVRAPGARRLVERGLVGVHQNDDTTFAPDDLRRRASDATSACADECDTSLESHGGGVYRTRAGDRRTQMDIPDDWGLEGKVALVSGGGAAGDGIGNGRAAAILLAKAGARVVVADRDLKLA